VALYPIGAGQVVMSWAAAGGSTVDTSHTTTGTPGTGTWLQLARTGVNSYSAYYSTASANGPWTLVGSVTTANAAQTQDVGLFAASASAYAPTAAGFVGFAVTG
jgi:hypothetical protein